MLFSPLPTTVCLWFGFTECFTASSSRSGLLGEIEVPQANHLEPQHPEGALFNRVVSILEDAQTHVSRTVNSAMVVAYWLIGKEIVEERQQGAERTEYGKRVIADLSQRLTNRYGRGFSVPNLRNFRQFYLVYGERVPAI